MFCTIAGKYPDGSLYGQVLRGVTQEEANAFALRLLDEDITITGVICEPDLQDTWDAMVPEVPPPERNCWIPPGPEDPDSPEIEYRRASAIDELVDLGVDAAADFLASRATGGVLNAKEVGELLGTIGSNVEEHIVDNFNPLGFLWETATESAGLIIDKALDKVASPFRRDIMRATGRAAYQATGNVYAAAAGAVISGKLTREYVEKPLQASVRNALGVPPRWERNEKTASPVMPSVTGDAMRTAGEALLRAKAARDVEERRAAATTIAGVLNFLDHTGFEYAVDNSTARPTIYVADSHIEAVLRRNPQSALYKVTLR